MLVCPRVLGVQRRTRRRAAPREPLAASRWTLAYASWDASHRASHAHVEPAKKKSGVAFANLLRAGAYKRTARLGAAPWLTGLSAHGRARGGAPFGRQQVYTPSSRESLWPSEPVAVSHQQQLVLSRVAETRVTSALDQPSQEAGVVVELGRQIGASPVPELAPGTAQALMPRRARVRRHVTCRLPCDTRCDMTTCA